MTSLAKSAALVGTADTVDTVDRKVTPEQRAPQDPAALVSLARQADPVRLGQLVLRAAAADLRDQQDLQDRSGQQGPRA
jgi:hypothetical protein